MPFWFKEYLWLSGINSSVAIFSNTTFIITNVKFKKIEKKSY